MIRKAYKFRIYPNQEQQDLLAIQFGHARFVYNKFLSLRTKAYEQYGITLNYYRSKRHLRRLKSNAEYVWLKEADSQVLQNQIQNLNIAYEKFFKKEASFPRFKSKHGKQSIQYPQRFTIADGRIYLPKVGWVKLVQHRDIEGKMKNCTVSKTKTGKYFISIQCEVEHETQDRNQAPKVGIDLGLKDFIATSDGDKVTNPKHLKRAERRLRIRQRRLSRKTKGSNNRNKARHQVALIHEKVANQRKDFHHKLSRQLVDQYGHIAFEDLNIQGMLKNRRLAKAISQVGWYQFIQFCEYKQAWAGGTIAKADRWLPSSKMCSTCGDVKKSLKLSERSWVCLSCGTHHDRDINASKNILNKSTVGATETHAYGDMSPVGGSA